MALRLDRKDAGWPDKYVINVAAAQLDIVKSEPAMLAQTIEHCPDQFFASGAPAPTFDDRWGSPIDQQKTQDNACFETALGCSSMLFRPTHGRGWPHKHRIERIVSHEPHFDAGGRTFERTGRTCEYARTAAVVRCRPPSIHALPNGEIARPDF